MKLRNLFLVSLAAMAITSCSNENDPIVDSGNTAETAMFNFSIALPNAPKTRATDPGTAEEQKVNDVTMVLEYVGINPPRTITKKYAVGEFTYDVTAKTYTLKTAEQVSPGNATLTIYVNSDGVPASQISATTQNGWSLGDYASITKKDGNFLMTGKSTQFTITPSTVNTAPKVEVERIAVKLDEATEDQNANVEGNQYVFEAKAKNTKKENGEELDIEATFLEYTYTNLLTKSNTVGSKLNGGAGDYYNYFVDEQKGEETLWSNAAFSSKIGMENHGVTYCFENGTEIPTTIYYKAKIRIEGIGEDANFYVYDNVLYKSFNELNESEAMGRSLDGYGLSDKSTNAQFMNLVGVKKYTKGHCYYAAVVNADGINRNNWYKLKVLSISDLGLPEPGTPPPGAKTTLIFSVTEAEWTCTDNEIHF